MATGDEVAGQIPDSEAGSQDLSELTCQPCHEDGRIREVVGICTDCQDYLCRKCYDCHIIPRPFKKHHLLDKQQMLRGQVKLDRKDKCTKKCSLHEEKTIKYYCIEHGQLGCSICLHMYHRACKSVQYIPEAAQSLDNNAEFKETEHCMNSLLESGQKVDISNIETERKALIESSCTEALECMEIHGRNVNEVLDNVQAEIVEDAEKMKASALGKITNITDKYQNAQRELQEFQEETEQLQRTPQNSGRYHRQTVGMKDRLKMPEDAMKKAKTDLSLLKNKIGFTPNLELLEMLKIPTTFGNLTGEDESGAIMHAEHVQDLYVKASSDESKCWITGSTFLSDSIVVIVDHHNRNIKAVDVKQNEIIAQTELSCRAWDVCTIKQDEVAATLLKENKIAFVKVKRDNMAVDKKVNVDGNCVGIAFKDGTLAVSFFDPHKVQVLTLNGTVLHNIATDLQGQPLFDRLHGLAFSKDGATLYVPNYHSNSVMCVKLDGTLVGTYTDRELQFPIGAAVDNDGNVYVCCEVSRNIHQISPDCRKIQVLLGQHDGLNKPVHISYNETDRELYVGLLNNNIMKVYRIFR